MGQQALGEVMDDGSLHNEACAIIRRMENESKTPSDIFANWIVKGIYSSHDWLSDFKQRAGIYTFLESMKLPQENTLSSTQNTQAVQQGLLPGPSFTLDTSHPYPNVNLVHDSSSFRPIDSDNVAVPTPPSNFDMYGRLRALLPDDTNFYRVFDSDMKRWAAATISPKNPNRHIPSNEEIQHQARWVMYDGDDPWNQTPADFEAWLRQFKKDVGIPTELDSGHQH